MRKQLEKCPHCGTQDRTVLFEQTRSGRIVRCSGCHLVYADPRMDLNPPVEMASLYKDKIAEAQWTKENFRDRLKVITDKTGLKTGRLLDVGCYAGFALVVAGEAGWDATGLEPDPSASEWGRNNLGVNIVTSTLEDADFENESFDVITFNHSWEHLDDSFGALERSLTWLKPGGVLYIEAPNFDNPWIRILGGRWRQFIADHYIFPTPELLQRVFEERDLETVYIGRRGKSMSVALFLDRISRYFSPGLGSFLTDLAQKLGLQHKTLRLNLGDILIALARKRDYTSN